MNLLWSVLPPYNIYILREGRYKQVDQVRVNESLTEEYGD